MSATEQILEEEVQTGVRFDSPWHVILFNDQVHAFDEVILQLMKATGCGVHRATKVALEAHHTGRSGAFAGGLQECLSVQSVLTQIGLITEITG